MLEKITVFEKIRFFIHIPSIFCNVQHADSEGTLLVDQDRLSMPTVTTMSSNPELKTALPGMIHNRQDHESSTGSLDDIKDSRLLQEEKAQSAEDRIGGENAEEEDLMGVEQVADFASSVLAAISCWRYRAKALLFDQITTVRVTYRFLFHVCKLAAATVHFVNRIPICCMLRLISAFAPTDLMLECSRCACMSHCMDITACMATNHT